jgi:uncharacterized membrane protein YeaQ/YmgE (transglycosylase-associated protein family)
MESHALMDLGGGVGILGTILIGGIAGWIAEKVTRSDMGLLMNIVTGIVGSFIGAFLANLLGLRLTEVFQGWFLGNLIVAAVGAIVLLLVIKAIWGRRAA